MAKTLTISIAIIICTLLICCTTIHITHLKINSENNYSISGNGKFNDPYILKDLKTGELYVEENGRWKLEARFSD